MMKSKFMNKCENVKHTFKSRSLKSVSSHILAFDAIGKTFLNSYLIIKSYTNYEKENNFYVITETDTYKMEKFDNIDVVVFIFVVLFEQCVDCRFKNS